VDRGEQEDADAGAPTGSMDEADGEGSLGRPGAVRFGMCVETHLAAPPAKQQPHREVDDHAADRRLGSLLDSLREESMEQENRQAEDEQGRRVAETPCKAELTRAPGGPILAARYERRHRGEVVRVRGVAQAEEDSNGEHNPQRSSVGKRGDSVVETGHSDDLRKGLEGEPDPDGEDDERAQGGQGLDEAALERQAAEGASGENRDEPDPGDRGREPEAESEDECEAETDSVEGDGAQEDDESRRAGKQSRCNPDADQSTRIVVVLVTVGVPVGVGAPMTPAPPEDGRADCYHEQT
jgi:hypothetical protein